MKYIILQPDLISIKKECKICQQWLEAKSIRRAESGRKVGETRIRGHPIYATGTTQHHLQVQ